MITDCTLSEYHKWFCVRILYQGSTLMYMFIDGPWDELYDENEINKQADVS